MDRDDNYEDIIDMERPWPLDTLRKHPKMSPQDRAKIFAPFAALRGHSERLGEEDVKLMRSKRTERSRDALRLAPASEKRNDCDCGVFSERKRRRCGVRCDCYRHGYEH